VSRPDARSAANKSAELGSIDSSGHDIGRQRDACVKERVKEPNAHPMVFEREAHRHQFARPDVMLIEPKDGAEMYTVGAHEHAGILGGSRRRIAEDRGTRQEHDDECHMPHV
jgi:hypothetical protein